MIKHNNIKLLLTGKIYCETHVCNDHSDYMGKNLINVMLQIHYIGNNPAILHLQRQYMYTYHTKKHVHQRYICPNL